MKKRLKHSTLKTQLKWNTKCKLQNMCYSALPFSPRSFLPSFLPSFFSSFLPFFSLYHAVLSPPSLLLSFPLYCPLTSHSQLLFLPAISSCPFSPSIPFTSSLLLPILSSSLLICSLQSPFPHFLSSFFHLSSHPSSLFPLPSLPSLLSPPRAAHSHTVGRCLSNGGFNSDEYVNQMTRKKKIFRADGKQLRHAKKFLLFDDIYIFF